MPLGSFEDQTFQSNHISFAENDIFIFYSDGLTEAKSPKREQYGPERIVDIVEKHPEASPRELIQRIKSSVISFVAKSAFEDDLTLIVIKIAQSKNIQQAKMKSANFTADLSELSKVRNYIHNLCINSVGDTERLSELLQLAIDEAFCNVVHHGYKNNKKGSIIIKGIVDAEGITIEIADQGEVYDPSRFKTPNLNEYKENGYGLFLINKIADSVVYIEKKSEGGWNHMFISKKYLTEGKNDD